MKKCTLLRIVSTFIAFSLLPLSALIGVHALDPLPHITPHYLLNGKEADTKDNFVFYKIDNKDEYAIGLTDEAKALTDVGDLPTVYKDENEDTHPVTGIWRNGFHKSKVTSISIGSNIKTIDFEAFMYSDLLTLTIPNTVERLGEAAFYACNQLQYVTFGKSEGGADECNCAIDPSPEEKPLVTLIPSFCFFKCSGLKGIRLPIDLVTIDPEAFNGCSKLASEIYLPKIKQICSRAFQSCVSLRNVYIGTTMFDSDSPGVIEPHSFQFCSSSLKITFYGDDDDISAWKAENVNWGLYTNTGDMLLSYTETTDSHSFTSVWEVVDFEPDPTKCKIKKYSGEDPKVFIDIPDEIGGRKVAEIDVDVFEDRVKRKIKRLYLPKYLLNINTKQFGREYTQLTVIADNDSCAQDSKLGDSYWEENGKIDLSNLKKLQFIGDLAFTDLGGGYKSGYEDGLSTTPRNKIRSVHLPANLIAVGSSAFSVEPDGNPPTGNKRSGNRFGYVTDFKWDYNDETSRLECIGGDAFMKFASRYGDTNTNKSGLENKAHFNHQRTTLIFPRTFKHFGITQEDIARYSSADFREEYGNNFSFVWNDNTILRTANRPAHCFAGCPLLHKVIFKGSTPDKEAENLLIPVQTFVLNESLQTVIFEERSGKTITFHTQGAAYWQQSIGASGGAEAGKVDFRADPMLQTLILPIQDTKIRMQDFAFFGNARAAIYFSGEFDETKQLKNGAEVYSNKQTGNNNNGVGHWPDQIRDNDGHFSSDGDLTAIKQWRTIGDETYSGGSNFPGYHGYCFTNSAPDNNGVVPGDTNSFGIDQKIHCYSSVHYKEVIKDDAGNAITTVEVGAGNSKELILDDTSKCAFVCDRAANMTATMSNYLYDLRSASIDVATVPSTITVPGEAATTSVVSEVTVSNAGTYTVNEIGDNAFSACYCDGNDGTNLNTPSGDGYRNDLKKVVIPNTVTKIGNYAFMRAYSLTEVSTSDDDDPSYIMPSNLTSIGKCAFAFCNVKQVRKIPKTCVLYENTSEANGRTPSAFINDFSLRRITFLDGSKEQYESDYYIATKYRISDPEAGNPDTVDNFQTTALYSKDASGGKFTSFKNRLLLVLYRENDHKTVGSGDSEVTVSEGKNSFNGKWKHESNAFLFGAYKMAYWIDNLTLGTTPSLENGDNNINNNGLFPVLRGQPLFSGICNRGTGGGITDKPIYLNNLADAYDYTINNGSLDSNHVCDLSGIEVTDMLSLPNYAFNGCEKIESVIFPKTGDTIPDGLFANNTKNGVKYYVEDPSEPVDGNVVDLRGSQIKTIGADLFKNNTNLTTFYAPDSSDGIVTIGARAFSGCKNLTTLDFSDMTGGTLQLNANAFEKCGNLTIKWPDSRVTIKLDKEYIFQGSAVTAIELPTNVNGELGTGIFKDCGSLTSVKLSENNPDITKIKNLAFENCRKLDTFDFEKFTGLTEVGEGAFRSTDNNNPNGTLGGNIELPATLDKIGKEAFKATKMTSLKITYAGDSLDLGEGCFAYNKSLTTVDFNKDSELSDDTYLRFDNNNKLGVFESCGNNLKEIYLPKDFKTETSKLVDFILGDGQVELFLYKKYSELEGTIGDGNWRKKAAQSYAPVYFRLDSTASEAFSELEGNNAQTVNYWAIIDRSYVKLGTATKSGSVYSFSVATNWILSMENGWFNP